MNDKKVTRFPGKTRPRPDEVAVQLLNQWEKECDHRDKGITVDEALLEVTCRGCGEKINPVWAIARMAEHESLWRRSRESYIQQRKACEERVRTKCQHCGQMTRIRGL